MSPPEAPGALATEQDKFFQLTRLIEESGQEWIVGSTFVNPSGAFVGEGRYYACVGMKLQPAVYACSGTPYTALQLAAKSMGVHG